METYGEDGCRDDVCLGGGPLLDPRPPIPPGGAVGNRISKLNQAPKCAEMIWNGDWLKDVERCRKMLNDVERCWKMLEDCDYTRCRWTYRSSKIVAFEQIGSTMLTRHTPIVSQCLPYGVSENRGTPSSYPFLDGIFYHKPSNYWDITCWSEWTEAQQARSGNLVALRQTIREVEWE